MADHPSSSSDLLAELAALRARVAELERAASAAGAGIPPDDAGRERHAGLAPQPPPPIERHLQLAFDHNPFPMWIYDVETLGFLRVNDAAVRQYGYTRDEFLRMTIADIRPNEDVPALLQWVSMGRADPLALMSGWRHRTKSGSIVQVDVVTREVEFAGRPAKLVLIHDITQRRRVERVMEGQRYFFELLATGAPLKHVLAELIRTVELQLDGGVCSILLLDADGRRLRHCVSSTLPKAYIQAIDGAEIGPSVGSCGAAIFRGEPVIVANIAEDPLWSGFRDVALAHGLGACWSVPFRDRQGRMLGTFAIYYPEPRAPAPEHLEQLRQAAYLAAVAVERTRADADLRASELRYRLVSHATSDVIWEWDAIANKLTWSDCGETVFGYAQDQVGTYATWWDERLHPEDAERAIGSIGETIAAGGEFWSAEYRFRRADGGYADVLDRAYVMRDDAGEMVRLIGAMQDISEQKRAEMRIRRLNEELERRVAERTAQLEAANKELEAFSYSVSHDLRAPLRHIDGFARLLAQRERGRLDETSGRYLQVVGDSARKMGQLIDDLLSFSRMGRAELQSRPLDLNQLAAEARAELAPGCEGRAIVWDVGPLPVVRGDYALIRVVLVNLLSNAIKYTAPRQPARIAISAECAGEEECVVTIRDNGVGFDAQYVHKLFGVFQRLHREEEFEGTGIGLANVRRIVNRHGGRVWAEGELDAGAAFHFTLKRFVQE